MNPTHAYPPTLKRNAAGRLELMVNGETFQNVTPVRAFPVTSPDDGIALISVEGREVLWIARIDDCPAEFAALLSEELLLRDFMPVISEIVGVSSFVTPCTWQVITDRGPTDFVLRGEEGIRKLGAGGLLITDSYGLQYLIKDYRQLERPGRKILDRFL
jgi:Domain of unknown function (DUF1854)